MKPMILGETERDVPVEVVSTLTDFEGALGESNRREAGENSPLTLDMMRRNVNSRTRILKFSQ
jgi:hypothetical protein